MKKWLVWIAAVIGLMTASSIPVQAQDGGERIRSFDSSITISPDNTAHVRETILYDFGSTSHHGIYRDIPIDYADGDQRFYLTAEYQKTVDENNTEVPAKTDEVDGNLRIKLGDEDKTVTGLKTYVITYTLSPVVMQKDGRPFLNLDVLGEGWKVPVDSFSAVVTLENNKELTNISWYGAESTAPQATARNIPPYRAVTINAHLPDSYVSTYLEPNKKRPFDVWKLVLLFSIIGLVVGGFVIAAVILWLRWHHAHVKRKAQTVIPEYDPPKGMTPAEIGWLDDDVADMREITATVIDWAVRGYLKITPVEKKGLFGGKDYTLTSLKSGEDLPENEKKLFDAFFSKGKEVALKDLDKSKMASATEAYKSEIKKHLSQQGFYDEGGNIIQKGNLTDKGAKQWAKVEGFEMYMKVVEKDRLKFSDAPEKTPERFNALLSYAVALGVEKEWAKQFEGIDVSQAVGWYSGNLAAFSAVSLASDIGTSFASTVSSNASVSSSGGSAGGGVGGGGGGSW